MKAHFSNRDTDQLSAYIDGQLGQTEASRLEARLRANPDMQAIVDDLRANRQLLRSAPRRNVPRNFTINSAQAAELRPVRPRWNLFPALSFTSALASFALVFSLAFGLFSGPSASLMAASAPETSAMSAQGEQNSAQPLENGKAARQPSLSAMSAVSPDTLPSNSGPVITWNTPSMGMGGGGQAAEKQAVDAVMNGKTDPAESIANQFGLANNAPGGQIVVPPQGVQSLPTFPAAIAPAPLNMQLNGPGPILGIPEVGQGGQVLREEAAMGFPQSALEGAPPVLTDNPAAGQGTPARERLFGMPRLAFVETLLALIAISTGLGALLVWRAIHGPRR